MHSDRAIRRPPEQFSRRDRARSRGFSLLEVVVALALMLLLLSGVFGFYLTALRVRNEAGQVTRDIAQMRAELLRIADDIRHATNMVPGDGRGFRGTRDNITIVRLVMPETYAFERHNPETDKLPPAQMGIRRIEYQLRWSEELKDNEDVPLCYGMVRTEQRNFDPNPKLIVKVEEEAGAAPEEDKPEADMPRVEAELSPQIKYLRFEYFDGADWQDRWQEAAPGAEKSESTEGSAGAGGAGDQGKDAGSSGDQGSAKLKLGSGRVPQVYALPQAVKITIGRIREDPEQYKFDVTQLKEMEERRKKEQHSDRLTIIVYLLQADSSQASSRMHGRKLQIGRETEGL